MTARTPRTATRTAVALLLAVGLVPVSTGISAAADDRAHAPAPTAGVAAPSRPTDTAAVDGLIVELRADRRPEAVRDRVAEATGRTAQLGRQLGGGARVLHVAGDLELDDASRLAARLERERLVVSAMPNIRTSPAAAPNDPMYGSQWALGARTRAASAYGIDAETAWATTIGAEDVVVAVLDTGVLAHPDITERLIAGYDFVDGDADASDPGDWCDKLGQDSSWHGTHVAGTVGATGDNGLGVTGVDRRARIQPVRVLGPCGGTMAEVVAGIRWAAGLDVTGVPRNPTPADVINLSLGASGSCDTTLQGAIDAANAAGSLVVTAAGNSDTDAGGYAPANCGDVLTVAATSPAGDRAFYSNYGAVVDLAAPGGDDRYGGHDGTVLSLGNTGTTVPDPDGMALSWQQGTSMAAPHVAGVASLALAADPTLTPAQLRDLLRDTATGFATSSAFGTTFVCADDPAAPQHCGAGIVDAAAALAALTAEQPVEEPVPPPTAPVVPAPTWASGATLRFDLDGGNVRLTWPRADGQDVTYDVLRDGDRVASTRDRTAVVTGLRADRRYRLQVRARNATGTSRAIERYVTPTDGFGDVPASSGFGVDIAWLATAEITRGCGSGRFCPGDAVTRQQMAAFLSRGLGLTRTSGIRFADVPAGSSFATDIDKLATAGITLGCGGDRFCPEGAVLRQQMAAFLRRALAG